MTPKPRLYFLSALEPQLQRGVFGFAPPLLNGVGEDGKLLEWSTLDS
jgi:hypothetical protein